MMLVEVQLKEVEFTTLFYLISMAYHLESRIAITFYWEYIFLPK